MHVPGHHQKRVHHAALGRFQALEQVVLPELVHQEADRALVHAVDRLGGAHEPVQGRSIRPSPPSATMTSASSGSTWRIASLQDLQRALRLGRRAGDERHMVETAGHAQIPSLVIGCGAKA